MKRDEELTAYLEKNYGSSYGGDSGDFGEGAHIGARWADEHPRWISVEDELPSLYDDYLVCTSGNIIEISHFNIDGWHNESAGKVTHWMSLPGLPEKGG